METVKLGPIALCCLMVAFGLMIHFVTKLKELEDRGVPIGAVAYLKSQPWNAMYVVLSAYGLLLLAYFTGELGPVGSFCMGVAANAAGSRLQANAQKIVENGKK